MSRQSAYTDVQAKGAQLFRDGKVTLLSNDPDIVLAKVEGYTGLYDVEVYRQDSGKSITFFECSCNWGQHAWNRETYYGRSCAHVLATLYASQSEQVKQVMNAARYTDDMAKVSTISTLPWDEQQKILGEQGGASNLDLLELSGTHYVTTDDDADIVKYDDEDLQLGLV